MVERTAQLLRLRAACALLIFLISGPMAQLATASSTSVNCSMACCIEDGFCCCNPHDEDHAAADSPEIEGAQLVRQCPNDCAAPGQVSKLQSRDSLRAASCVAAFGGAEIFRLDQNIAPARTYGSARSAPRAPPALLATSSIA